MAKDHVVAPGEHLPAITARHGWNSPDLLWNHPDNAALKAKRTHGEILAPGDVVRRPDKVAKEVSVATGQTHVFVVTRQRLELRLRVRDLSGKPIAGAATTIRAEGASLEKSTDGQGILSAPIPLTAMEGAVTLGPETFDLAIAGLAPIDEELGWQQRLVNLGNLEDECPSLAKDYDEKLVRSAIEEFECDQGLPLTGQMTGATRDELKAVHGC